MQTVEFYTDVSSNFVVCLSLLCGQEQPDETRKGVLTAGASFRGGSVTKLHASVLDFKICYWFSKRCTNINIHQELGPLGG